jgi:carbonic anhydrase
VLNDEGLGSIEYGVDVLGARLIVVLGHQSCGAVDAAMKTVAVKGKAPGPHSVTGRGRLSPW